MQSTALRTKKYIDEHPLIKSCLKKGLINYSALARHISRELNISKKTSIEAILIAARRIQNDLQKDAGHDMKISNLLKESKMQVKNKISVITLNKSAYLNKSVKLQTILGDRISYVLEGNSAYTIIADDDSAYKIIKMVECIEHKNDLVMIQIISSSKVAEIPGVLSYLTSLFAENGVNIVEFMSCYTDTLFILDKNEIMKVLDFLDF